jgi:carboxypeptidase family protein
MIRGCILLMLIGSVVLSDPVPTGVVKGHVKIFPLSDVNLADDGIAARSEAEQPFSEYPLIIRSRDTNKEVARVTADETGNYRVELPPGNYILEVQGPESKPAARATPRPVTVLSNQTVRVDVNIDTGIR